MGGNIIGAGSRLRVIVWGPGALGSANLRLLLDRPEYELVGVLAYSGSKIGKDAGELIGRPPTGVVVTGDQEAIFALSADCVLFTPQTHLDTSLMDSVVCRLLESGKNIIASPSYFYPPMRGSDYAKRLYDACMKGRSTLHGSGLHPPTLLERLTLTLTGYCTELEHISFQEVLDLSHLNSEHTLAVCGFGAERHIVEDRNSLAAEMLHRYFREPIGAIAKAMYDAEPDRVRVEAESTCTLAERDIDIPGIIRIPEGRALNIRHKYRGYVDDRHFVTTEEIWYLGRGNCPLPNVNSTSHYIITIEGKPTSLQVRMDGKPSFMPGKEDLVCWPGDPTTPVFYLTAAPMIQAIPVVCAAPPGILQQQVFAHFASDFRNLAHNSGYGKACN